MSWIDFIDNYVEINNTKYSLSEKIEDISWFPKNTYGFVYLIEYTDGTSYIGKKNLFSYRTVHKLKNGGWPKGVIEVTVRKRNTGKDKRIEQNIAKIESNWKTYQGSHADCKTKTVKNKFVIAIAKSSFELTYLEAKYLFAAGVLESDTFLNDNILGRFYKGHLYGEETESLTSN